MDINQISFGIKGEAQQATRSLGSLIGKLDVLDASFTKVSTSGQTFIGVLSTIASMGAVNKTAMSGMATTAKTTATAVDKVGASTQKTATTVATATTKTAKMSTVMNTLTKTTDKSGTAMSRLIQRITQITFLVYVARRALQAFGAGVKSSINYVENLNLFMVALGQNTSRATGFIKEMSDSLYLDEAQLTRVQGLFYQISESLGLGSEKAYTLSENFTKLAYDLASFYNITIDAAVTKLQAGLVGETEPLRRIGIIITENNLAETARSIGIKKSIRNMTEQEKIQLRYITALQQTKNAQGDLARTLEQPENLLRILKEQFNILMRELGNVAIPVIKELIPQVIGLTVALSRLASAWATSLGYKAPVIRDDLGGHMKTIADESDDTAKSTDKTAKNLAKVLKYTRETASSMTGIDELNILSDSGSVSGVDSLFPAEDLANSTKSIDLALEGYNNKMSESAGLFDDIVNKWNDLFVTISTKFTGIFDPAKEAIKGLWAEITGDPKTEDEILGGAASVLRTINDIITGIALGLTDVVRFFKDLFDVIKPVLEMVAPDWLNDMMEGQSGSIAKTVAFLTKAFVAWKVIKFATGFVTAINALITLGGLVGGATGLLALFGAMVGVKLVLDIGDAMITGDWAELRDKILQAIVNGLATTALTGSIVGGVIVFGISTLVEFNVKDMKVALGTAMFELIDMLLVKPIDYMLNNLVEALNKMLDVVNWFIPGENFDAKKLPYFNMSERYRESLKLDEGKENAEAALKATMPTVTPYITPNITPSVVMPKEETSLESVLKMLGDNNTLVPDSIEDSILRFVEDNFLSIVANMGAKGRSLLSPQLLLATIGEMGWSHKYATGGKPAKGNLFVAGEAGPELVTEHNGETVVMNEKQLKERGVSFFADGVNVPKWTVKEQRAAGGSDTVKNDLNKIFNTVPNAIAKAFNKFKPKDFKMTEGAKEAVRFVKNMGEKAGMFWEGLKKTDMVQGVTTAFKGFVTQLKDGTGILGKTYKVMSKVGKGVATVVAQAFGAFKDKGVRQIMSQTSAGGGTTAQQQGIAGDVIGASLGDSPAGMIFNLMQSVADGSLGMFVDSLPMFVQAGVDMLKNLITGIVAAMPELMKAIPEVIRSIVGILTDKDSLNMIIEGLLSIVANIVMMLPEIILALVDAIPMIIETLLAVFIENIPMFFKIGVLIASAIIEGLVNIIISGINWLIRQINKIPFVNIGYLDSVGWTQKLGQNMGFADGGFPTQGQMFIAREAGAELVGNIGGSTAVANNDQIVAAVSDGVYRAVSQAMGEQGNKPVVVNMNGRKVSDALDNTNRSRGLVFGMGGY